MSTLAPGVPGTVIEVQGRQGVVLRLMEMGLVPGTRVRVVKIAPLGDPLEIELRGYHLSLRRAEAQRVGVEVA